MYFYNTPHENLGCCKTVAFSCKIGKIAAKLLHFLAKLEKAL